MRRWKIIAGSFAVLLAVGWQLTPRESRHNANRGIELCRATLQPVDSALVDSKGLAQGRFTLNLHVHNHHAEKVTIIADGERPLQWKTKNSALRNWLRLSDPREVTVYGQGIAFEKRITGKRSVMIQQTISGHFATGKRTELVIALCLSDAEIWQTFTCEVEMLW